MMPSSAAAPATAPAGDDVAVSVDRVTKRFAVRAEGTDATTMLALDAIGFTVQRGHLASLLGASGCGKTTLLRIAAGLILADEGRIAIDAVPVQAPRNDVCMVFQNFGLLPWRSVLDNVAFPLELDGVGAADRYATSRHYIALVGLTNFEGHYPHELSGGMQQRVGIARALVRRPKVLLMDEPFAALDAQTRETLQEDFLRIWQELKTTVLFVTHSIDEALVLSDRIVVFTPRPGRVHRIIDAPLGPERFDSDPRALPEFGRWRREIRDMLRQEISA